MATIRTWISEVPLRPEEALEEVRSDTTGAVASFVGTVRASAAAPGHDDARVERLEYEAHPELAEAKLREIATEAAARWGLEGIIATHRTGICALGEPTVVIACAAAHRKEALAACVWTIDEIKRSVPIWKREVYDDGEAWVGAEGTAPN